MRPPEILLGKAIPAVIIGLLEATVIFLIIVFWFKVPLLGSLLALYLGLFLLSAIGMGLMISSLAVTQQQGLLGAFLFFVPEIILSGFSTPASGAADTDPAQSATLLSRHPARRLSRRCQGEPALAAVLAMALFGLFCLFTAGTLFRSRMA